MLLINVIFRADLKSFEISCKYKQFGCQVTVPLPQLKEHENACAFYPLRCPNYENKCTFIDSLARMPNHRCPLEEITCKKGCGSTFMWKDRINHTCIQIRKN